MSSHRTRRQSKPLVIEGYQVFKETEDQPGAKMVKTEPADPEYERSAQMNGIGLTETGSSTSNVQCSDNIREQLKQMVEDKGKELTVKNVVEDLLQSNKIVQPLKPPTLPQKHNAPDTGNQLVSVLQPKDPTPSCSNEDMSSYNDALVEVAVTDSDSSTDTDLVCAVSSKSVLIMQKGQSFQIDVTYYWCNFCSFKSDKKETLLQHVMKHRFNCKYCKYQSFSRAAVIKHGTQKHPAFSETGSSLKYCSYLPDILSRHDVNKRKISDSQPNETIPSTKKMRLESNDNVILKMEVEEINENQESESDAFVIPNSIDNPNKSPAEKKPDITTQENMVLPVITNVVSGEMAVSAATEITSSEQSPVQTPDSSTPSSTSSLKGPSGSSQTLVSSGLCWHCGYCGFVTLSQSILKIHLNAKHQGQAHKYVAMLVSSAEELEKIKASDHQISTNPAAATDMGENILSPSTNATATVPSKISTNTTAPSISQCESKSFGIEIDNAELDTPKTLEEKNEETVPLTFKCAHCNFTASAAEKVKVHLFQRHKNCVMYALDMRAVKLREKRYVFFCMKSKCRFQTKEVSEFIEHSDKCTPWLDGKEKPNVDNSIVKSLEMTKQFVLKTQGNAGGQTKQFKIDKITAEYSCLYCSHVSNNNTRLKKHVLSLHVNKKCVIKDLFAEKNKRKLMVFFCTHCLWETREEEELNTHMEQVHDASTSAATPNSGKNDTIKTTNKNSQNGIEPTCEKITVAKKATNKSAKK